MKIMMFIDSLDVGGAETHVEVLAKELLLMNHEIIIATTGGKIYDKLQKNKIKRVLLPKILKTNSAYGTFSFVLSYFTLTRQFFRLIEREKPDIVHAHTRRTAFLAERACKKFGVPLVVTAHAYSSMKFPKNLFSKWGDYTIAVGEDIKNHLTEHKVPRAKIEIIPNGVRLPQKTTTKI